MKLANVVFCRTKDFNNEWAVSNDQYDNEIIENVSTSQKIKIGRYLTASLEKVLRHIIVMIVQISITSQMMVIMLLIRRILA